MELRHLRYFVAAAAEENISRAALKLHVSQPGISRQIRDLEGELGFPLFERTAKALKLTTAGRVFLEESRAVLQRMEEGIQKARSVVEEGRGELHIGYAPSLTVQILPATLRDFQKKWPQARVALHDLSTGEMLEQLRTGSLDIALMVKVEGKYLRKLASQELIRYPLCLAVSPRHALSKAKKADLDQILAEPLIIYSRSEYPEYYEMLVGLFGKSFRRLKIAEEHEGVSGIILGVESGAGVALVPECFACLVGPRLKLIPLDNQVVECPVMMAWKPPVTSLHLQQLIESIQSSAATLSNSRGGGK